MTVLDTKSKVFSIAEDVALVEMNKALDAASRFVNLASPDIEPDDVVVKRIRTPVSVVYSLRRQRTSNVVPGTVSQEGVKYLSDKGANEAVADTFDRLFKTNSDPAVLRGRVLNSDFNERVLEDQAVAMTQDHCYSCSGHGTFTCSPCGGRGNVDCNRCLYTGYTGCYVCGSSGRVGNSTCGTCWGNGRVRCGWCGGSARVRCNGCNGHGTIGCGTCGSTGLLTTIHGCKITSSSKITVGKTALNDDQKGLLRIWLHGGPKNQKPKDDLVTPWSDLHTAAVTKLAEQSYMVFFCCDVTVTRLNFTFEGDSAWGEFMNIPLSWPVFSPFLNKVAAKASDVITDRSSPSKIAGALERAGYSRLAGILKKGGEDFHDSVRQATYGAVTGDSVSDIWYDYRAASLRFTERAMLGAWKLPIVLTTTGWAAASYFEITKAAAEAPTIYPMAGLIGGAGLIAVLSSNYEARRAIKAETGNVKGKKIGFTAIASGVAAACLFWTSTSLGINL